MANSVDSIEHIYWVGKVLDDGGKKNQDNQKFSKPSSNRIKKNILTPKDSSSEVKTEQGIVDNIQLTFNVNNLTKETVASVTDNVNKISKNISFDELTKANERVFERRGIVFDEKI